MEGNPAYAAVEYGKHYNDYKEDTMSLNDETVLNCPLPPRIRVDDEQYAIPTMPVSYLYECKLCVCTHSCIIWAVIVLKHFCQNPVKCSHTIILLCSHVTLSAPLLLRSTCSEYRQTLHIKSIERAANGFEYSAKLITQPKLSKTNCSGLTIIHCSTVLLVALPTCNF